MKQLGIALLAGFIFGIGLSVSQMIDRNRVLNFLDVSGNWDATLLFTMLGALSVSFISFRIILNRNQPLYESSFKLPTRSDVDKNLLMGAALFGIGWGLTGYCPGPAVASLGLGLMDAAVVVVSISAGFLLHKYSSRYNL